MSFSITYLQEPELMFLHGSSFTPMVGLIKHGARFSIPEETTKWMKVGIIGSSQSLSLTLNLLEEMRHVQVPKKIAKWNIPFPGLSENSPLHFAISFKPEWQQKITQEEIEKINSETTRTKRTEAFAQKIDEKLRIIYENISPPPDVVIVTIPLEIEKKCMDPTREKPLLKLPKGDDLHSRIKLSGMKYKIPTQLIRNDTLIFHKTQEKSIVFWNLAVGLLYKSQKGYPWKLAKFEPSSCYVGISFFHDSSDTSSDMRACMAQVFLDTGESYVLRGKAFEWRDRFHLKNPHLPKEGAKEIIKDVLSQYKAVRGVAPERIVIHKSSNYWDEEKEGFLEGAQQIHSKDFLTIQPSDLKYYREGKYPVLRGTLISLSSMDEHFLYTTGMVPCLNTYPGLGIPRPVNIRCPIQSSPIQTISQEILAFTKLDWNNTFVYQKIPITMSVSDKVKMVLADSSAKEMKELDPHYYYYM